jgi:leukotriene-A4 hydrolase
MVDKATKEFEDTEKMIATTEQLYGPYRWDRYDMLVLPPSFPYGGMENPRLTFITPTVIVGDKSLVSLIAHELAHSWSGNLVTFSSAKHGWLNEGFTSYVENRIVESLYGKEQSSMEYAIARNALKKEIGTMPEATQALAVKPGTKLDADDALSAVSYDKGAWFLQFLEERFGRQEFDAFLRGYFDHFAFQSITTEQFLASTPRSNLFDKHPNLVSDAEIQEWIYGRASRRCAAGAVARLLQHRHRAHRLAGQRPAAQPAADRCLGDPAVGALHRRHGRQADRRTGQAAG